MYIRVHEGGCVQVCMSVHVRVCVYMYAYMHIYMYVGIYFQSSLQSPQTHQWKTLQAVYYVQKMKLSFKSVSWS